jgi:hypothetical protein
MTLRTLAVAAVLSTMTLASPAFAQRDGGFHGGDFHGGGFHRGFHDFHHGGGFFLGFGGPGWWGYPYWDPYFYGPYPYAYPYSYPYPYAPYDTSAAPAPPAATGATGTTVAVAQPHFVYRCDNPAGYYPSVSSCPGGWHEEQAPSGASGGGSGTMTPLAPPR